jgi:cell division protein FtsA
MEQKYIVAIEIGSSKIKGAVGSTDETGALTVIAVEEEKLVDCVRYGCIQNVEEVSNRVLRIVRSLEENSSISPRKIKGVYVGMGGRSLSASSREVQRQLPDELEITERIITQIKDEARSANMSDKDVVDVLPRSFTIDNQPATNPVGIFGQQINANLNLLTCKPQIRRNLNRVICERLQLGINGYIVRPIAVADLVLSDDEKRLGCMLVDFGAETTTVSIYKDGALHYLETIPLGSRNITRDITSINHLEEKAEELKKAVGCANPQEQGGKKNAVDGIDVIEINNYVQARAGEIVANIIEQIKYADYKPTDLPAGIIVVGGGAKLKGFNSLLEAQSSLKVRSGAPLGLIRITDNRIQPSDSVDVISILMSAIRVSAVDCLEKIPVIVDTTDDTTEKREEEKKEKETKEKGPSLINRLKDRLARIIDLEEDGEEDEDGY